MVIVALLLAGCAARERIVYRDVALPVPGCPAAPAEIAAPVAYALPRFIAPGAPAATSALDVSGEKLLREMLSDLHVRVEICRAFAAAVTSPNPSEGAP